MGRSIPAVQMKEGLFVPNPHTHMKGRENAHTNTTMWLHGTCDCLLRRIQLVYSELGSTSGFTPPMGE